MKKPFDLSNMFRLIEASIAPYPKAAMFDLYERGYTTLFEQLVSCIISIRTLDETTIPVSLRLFAAARTPEAMLRLERDQLADLLLGSTFPGQKADTIRGIAQAAVESGGHLPADFKRLTDLKGVGPKCANLALGVIGQQAGIGVDIHVHRVTNRWGLVAGSEPQKTRAQLEEALPSTLWTDINRLLVPFGKHICTGKLPHCSTCPVLEYCRQVGVTKHR